MQAICVGGQLIHGDLMQKQFGFNPMPAIGVVMAELAAAIQSLSTAIAHAGTPKAFFSYSVVPFFRQCNDLQHIAACL